MARKKIHTTRVGSKCSVSIYRDREYDEFVVRATVNGKVIGGKKDGGAFESDKKAARSTAAAMVRELRRKHSICKS